MLLFSILILHFTNVKHFCLKEIQFSETNFLTNLAKYFVVGGRRSFLTIGISYSCGDTDNTPDPPPSPP